MSLDRTKYQGLLDARVCEPASLQKALVGNLLILAADHTARGKISLGLDPIAMSDRYNLLDRLTRCLALPEVDGVLASADILEELAFLGALNDKLAIGTMNRGGIIGAKWELDDRLTSYDADHIESMGLDGGKTLIRIDYQDPSVARTIETVAALTTQLADRKLMAMIEPLPYKKSAEGMAILDDSDEALIKVVSIASGLGSSSAYSWLKVPATNRMSEVAGATSLPVLMLGGEPEGNPDQLFNRWTLGMKVPNVRGLVAGRSLLYPVNGDSESAVRRAGQVVRPTPAGGN
jgi:hypothetical protein